MTNHSTLQTKYNNLVGIITAQVKLPSRVREGSPFLLTAKPRRTIVAQGHAVGAREGDLLEQVALVVHDKRRGAAIAEGGVLERSHLPGEILVHQAIGAADLGMGIDIVQCVDQYPDSRGQRHSPKTSISHLAGESAHPVPASTTLGDAGNFGSGLDPAVVR